MRCHPRSAVRPGRRDKKLCCVRAGLDNAGKTTLIYRLKSGKINSFIPTQRANIEEFVRARSYSPAARPVPQCFGLRRRRPQEYGGVSFKAFDLGGHAAVRKLWTDYMTEVDAVVFVVDSNDAARHDEARDVSARSQRGLRCCCCCCCCCRHRPPCGESAIQSALLKSGRLTGCETWICRAHLQVG